MNNLDILKSEYPGDVAWEKFLSLFKPIQSNDPLNRLVDSELLSVLAGITGNVERAAAWLQKEIPALEGKTTLEVLEFNPDGEKIIRCLLMRMP